MPEPTESSAHPNITGRSSGEAKEKAQKKNRPVLSIPWALCSLPSLPWLVCFLSFLGSLLKSLCGGGVPFSHPSLGLSVFFLSFFGLSVFFLSFSCVLQKSMLCETFVSVCPTHADADRCGAAACARDPPVT